MIFILCRISIVGGCVSHDWCQLALPTACNTLSGYPKNPFLAAARTNCTKRTSDPSGQLSVGVRLVAAPSGVVMEQETRQATTEKWNLKLPIYSSLKHMCDCWKRKTRNSGLLSTECKKDLRKTQSYWSET